MRAIYALRVLLVSLEAVILAGAWFAWTYFPHDLQTLAASLTLNGEVLRNLMLLPGALAVWVINQTRILLQEDNETVRILTDWPDYWKLKIHTWTSFFYAVIFVAMSLIPWVFKSEISTGSGMLLFLVSIIGQLLLAVSVYAAQIRVKEIIAHAKAP